jgi:hypothetical protein
MYQDFYYVRPPVTPYLHTFEMALFPETMVMVAYRFFFYVFLWLSVFFSVKTLQRYFDFGKTGASPWWLGAIAYVLSVHNFFAAPWHTVDGIVFASLGFFVISRGSRLWLLAAGLFVLGLSAMCKQPFAVVPLAGLPLLYFHHPWKRALSAIALASLAALFAGILIEFWLTPEFGFFHAMREQATGVTSFEDMKYIGFKLYIGAGLYSFVPAALLWYILNHQVKSLAAGKVMGTLVFLGFLTIALVSLIVTLQAQSFMYPQPVFYPGLLFCGGGVAMLTILKRDRMLLSMALAMMSASWASGISWGYTSPVLYTAPAVLTIAYFLVSVAKFSPPKWFWPTIFAICLVSVGTLNLYIYDDDPRTKTTNDLGTVFPRLSHISAGKAKFTRYQELKQLHARYGDRFTVLPSMPLAHYVTNTEPRIPIDLVHDAEINYQSGIKDVIARLEASPNRVFAMKSELAQADRGRTYRCSVLKHVITHWAKIDSTAEFLVYDNQVPISPADQ